MTTFHRPKRARMRLRCSAALLISCLPVASFAQEAVELDEIVVTSESRRGVATDTAVSETVIDQEEIDARQASSMTELLDSVPNVALVNGGMPQGSTMSIRGLGSLSGIYGTDGKIAVVIDGVASGAEEIYRNGSMFAMEPELFREVKVQRGPAESFRYSSGAMGGTIEAVTKDASDFLEEGDTFAFRQKLGYESNGDSLLSTSILAFSPDDRLDVLLFAGYRNTDDREDGAGETLDATGFEQPSALAKISYALNDASTLTFGYSYNKIPEYDVPYNAYNASWGDTLVDRVTEDSTAYLAYRYNPLDNDLINLEARLTFKDEKMDISNPSSGSTSGIYNAAHQTKTLGLRVENEAYFATGQFDHTLSAGIELKRRERSSVLHQGTYAGYNDNSAPGGTDESIAVYLVDEIHVGGLTLTPQLRYEKQTLTSQNNDYDVVTCRPVCVTVEGVENGETFKSEAITGALSARYEFTDNFAVFGTAAYNENLPILDDLRDETLRAQSEKGRSFELGLSYDALDVLSSEDRLQLKLTAFKTDIWDATTYSGIDQVELYGAEFELSYASAAFYVDFNAGMTRGTINGTSDDFKYVPADSVQLTLGKTFLDDQLDLSVEAKHAWAQTKTPDTNVGYYPGTVPSDAYTTYSLSAAYTPDSGSLAGVEFRASVENLFDETYRPYLSTRNAPGRTIKLSVAKTF